MKANFSSLLKDSGYQYRCFHFSLLANLKTGKMEDYTNHLKSKVIIAENYGFNPIWIPEIAKPHQKDICHWSIAGGRRAVFASFGLGKTFIQLIIGANCIKHTDKPFLIGCPLGVVGEFKRDNRKLKSGYEIEYITDTDNIENYENKIYLTNYERIRKGDIDATKFGGVSFDEASVLRNLKTETTNYVLNYFGKVPYRFVATASPCPNEFIEILNYAQFLGVADRGHLLTRFFKRNSTKAGDLTLLDSKKKEFWQWVSTWAAFINKPSDLGYDDTGYDLPELEVIEHCIDFIPDEKFTDKSGNPILHREGSGGFSEQSKEKRSSINVRLDETIKIIKSNPDENMLLWHHLEDERKGLEKMMKGQDLKTVFGSQKNSLKEDLLIDFSDGKFKYLGTKPEIAGSGCNFQGYCRMAIFMGINDKFNDFIQAIHRILRYGQERNVIVHVVFTNYEQKRWANIKRKWAQHDELQKEMISLVKEYGLRTDLIKSKMERQLFENGDKVQIGDVTSYNNDSVLLWADKKEMPDDSQDMQLSSIPFGDHYEYSDYYNDMGHNHGNENFFKQMDFLIPNLWRTLKPGRVCAIHVKDRIRYSYQNGTSFTTIDDFSGKTVERFTKGHILKDIEALENIKPIAKDDFLEDIEKRIESLKDQYKDRFHLMGKITVTTDVVAENNQTYRLGHSEKCKDGSKMGCGLPEYILLFRKAPTESNNAYADKPVTKAKEDYPVWLWQLDAHAFWRSSGDIQLPVDELIKRDLKYVVREWKKYQKERLYDFKVHKDLSKKLDSNGKLSRKFMTVPPISNNEMVWDNVRRTNTLNTKQTHSKKEKHICPLQLDLIERLIELFTEPGETIGEPFGGLGSTAYKAIEMGRKCIISELNTQYYKDGLFYIRSKYEQLNMPTLFDVLEMQNK